MVDGVDIPDKWVLAMGGKIGGQSSRGDRNSGSTTVAIMLRGASERVVLPSVPGAAARTQSVTADRKSQNDVVRASSSACPEMGAATVPAPKKPEPFSMASLMESARRKAQDKKDEAAAQARGEVFQRVSSSDDDVMESSLKEYRERQKELQGVCAYMYVCVCTYICRVCVHIYLYIYMWVYTCICVYLYIHICIHIYIYVHKLTYIYIHTYIYALAYLFSCTCKCIFICVCIFMSTYLSIYLYHLLFFPVCDGIFCFLGGKEM